MKAILQILNWSVVGVLIYFAWIRDWRLMLAFGGGLVVGIFIAVIGLEIKEANKQK